MKSYISATGIKKVTISNPGVEIGKGGGGCAAAAARRFSGRTLLLLLLLLAIVPPFIFVRFAFLVLESASVCDSPLVENPSALSRLDEQGSEQTSLEAIAKMISQQDYLAKIHALRDGITCAWQAEDRVTSLKLSIKVTKLLMDTTVLQL